MDKGALTLSGGISMFSDDGYELHTASADVDLKKGIVQGPRRSDRAGTDGHACAPTLSSSTAQTKQLTLHGHVHMTINPREAHQT